MNLTNMLFKSTSNLKATFPSSLLSSITLRHAILVGVPTSIWLTELACPTRYSLFNVFTIQRTPSGISIPRKVLINPAYSLLVTGC